MSLGLGYTRVQLERWDRAIGVLTSVRRLVHHCHVDRAFCQCTVLEFLHRVTVIDSRPGQTVHVKAFSPWVLPDLQTLLSGADTAPFNSGFAIQQSSGQFCREQLYWV